VNALDRATAKLEAADVLLEEVQRRRSIIAETRDAEDARAALTLFDAARILIETAELEGVIAPALAGRNASA